MAKQFKPHDCSFPFMLRKIVYYVYILGYRCLLIVYDIVYRKSSILFTYMLAMFQFNDTFVCAFQSTKTNDFEISNNPELEKRALCNQATMHYLFNVWV